MEPTRGWQPPTGGAPPQPTDVPPRRWLPMVLGYLLPLWIAIAGFVALERLPIRTDPVLRNQFARALTNQQPEVVVLGNSLTAAGIDEGLLEKHLGAEVTVLTVAGSEAPAWYAVLKNSVFGSGHSPRVVLVVNRIDSLLSVDASSQQDILHLDQLMTTDEPVLTEKVLYRNVENPRWEFLMRRRTQLSRTFLDGLRDLAGAMAGMDPEAVISSHNRVFAEENIDYGLYAEPIPVAEEGELELTDPAESLTPDLIDLADAHGAKFVFVRIPSAPGAVDVVDGASYRALIELLNERGAGFVNVPDQPMSATDYQDPLHLNEQGRRKYSNHLGGVLSRFRIADPSAPLPRARVPYAAPDVSRRGKLPEPNEIEDLGPMEGTCTWEASFFAVAELLGPRLTEAMPTISVARLTDAGLPPASPIQLVQGEQVLTAVDRPWRVERDCTPGTYALMPNRLVVVPFEDDEPVFVRLDPAVTVQGGDKGTITWVYPGTTTVLESTEPWRPAWGKLAFSVLAQPWGGAGGQATVALAEGPQAPLTGRGGLVLGYVESPSKRGHWKLRIKSPRDGPFLALHTVDVGNERRSTFLGSGRSPDQLTLNVIGRTYALTDPEYANDTPAIPGNPQLSFTNNGLGIYASRVIAPLSDKATGRCSPVAVLEDGEPLIRHRKCEDVVLRPGTQCHVAGQVRFHPSSDPSTHEYDLVFDRTPNATCKTELWVLPGDTMSVQVDSDDLQRFLDGPDLVEMTAEVYRLGNKPIPVQVTLSEAGREIWRAGIGPGALARGYSKALGKTIGPRRGPITLTIENTAPVALLFQKVTLVERVRRGPGATARKDP